MKSVCIQQFEVIGLFIRSIDLSVNDFLGIT